MAKTTALVATENTTSIASALQVLLGLDKAALAEVAKTNPELGESINLIKMQIAEAGSPLALAQNLGLDPKNVQGLSDWMLVKKGASTYLGTEGKIAERSFAIRMVLPTKKAEDATIADKIKELTVRTWAAAEQFARELGLTSI